MLHRVSAVEDKFCHIPSSSCFVLLHCISISTRGRCQSGSGSVREQGGRRGRVAVHLMRRKRKMRSGGGGGGAFGTGCTSQCNCRNSAVCRSLRSQSALCVHNRLRGYHVMHRCNSI